MTLQQFYDALMTHDWYYHNSDDSSVFAKGEREYKRLRVIAELGGTSYQDLFNRTCDYFYSGSAFKTERAERPTRPE